MPFTDDQIAALKAPLSREHVKDRKQAGRKVNYIEGWHAIAEANRIFGFDAWDRKTVDLKLVSEKPCEIGEQRRPGFRVAYTCRVRITVYAGDRHIVREGCGYGSGIDADVGEAHESAVKEAETDAMKRGLMTFGNPFGLALYDKTQADVTSANPQSAGANGATRPASTVGSRAQMVPGQANSPAGPGPTATTPASPSEHPRAEEARAAYRKIKDAYKAARLPKVIDDITKVHTDNIKLIKEVSPDSYEALMQFATAHKGELLSAA